MEASIMSKKFIKKEYQKTPATFFARAAEIKNSQTNIIDLSLGDPDLKTAAEIVNQAAADANQGYTHYAHPRGDFELREAIVAYYKKNYNQLIDLDQIMITVGACHGTFLALAAILNEGEEIIIPTPYFAPYKGQVELAGGKAVFVKSKFEADFQLDLDAVEEKITPKTKAILINSPHNPTGIIQKKKVLEKLIELAIKYDILILSDEVYENFDYKSEFYSLVNFNKQSDRIIILNSFSKTFAMTGWRLGFLIADPDLINVMQNLNEGICYSAPSISQRAAIKALTSENLKEEIRNCFAKRVSYANQIISANSELDLVKAEGAFYLFPRIKKTGLKAEEFALRLLKEEGVLVLPGDDFGDQNGEFIRIACTLELSKLTEALARICSFTKKLKDDNLSNSKLNK